LTATDNLLIVNELLKFWCSTIFRSAARQNPAYPLKINNLADSNNV